MKGERKIIAELNKVLGFELIAINQYFLHARILKNWGFLDLGQKVYKESIAVMKDADKIIERVLFLEGLPNLQNLGKLNIGQDVPEVLKSDFNLESRTHAGLLEAIGNCEDAADFVSREVLQDILDDSEERLDFYDTQIQLIGKMGLENYLQTASGHVT